MTTSWGDLDFFQGERGGRHGDPVRSRWGSAVSLFRPSSPAEAEGGRHADLQGTFLEEGRGVPGGPSCVAGSRGSQSQESKELQETLRSNGSGAISSHFYTSQRLYSPVLNFTWCRLSKHIGKRILGCLHFVATCRFPLPICLYVLY